LSKPELLLSPDAQAALAAYSWPGNVRELENLMERMAILCECSVGALDLALGPDVSAQQPTQFREIERQAILNALEANRGNRTRAARQLGISVRTLQYRLKQYQSAQPDEVQQAEASMSSRR
jgi:two-component system response regulator HydG